MKNTLTFRVKVHRRALVVGFAMVVFTAIAVPSAFSQSCSLCYTQAASAGNRMIEALRSGILVLIIPPTLASVGMICVIRNKSQVTSLADETNSRSSDW